MLRVCAIYGLMMSVLAVGTATAQAVRDVPDVVNPDQYQDLQKFYEQEHDVPAADLPSSAPSPAAMPEGAESITFTLRTLSLDGNTLFAESLLSESYHQHLGHEISVATLYAIAAGIESFYHERGYSLVRVIVPPQDIENGEAELHVVEGRVRTVHLAGTVEPSPLLRRIAGKIAAAKPLYLPDLERQLLLLNDVPGVSAQSVIQPVADGAPGEVDILIQLEPEEFIRSVSLDNAGSRYVGPHQFGYRIGTFDGLPYHHQTVLGGFSSVPWDELQFLQLSHSAPLNSHGTRATAEASYSYSTPGYLLESQEIMSESYYASVGVSHPIIRSRKANLSVDMNANWKDIRSEALDTPLYEDRLRTTSLSLSGDRNDSYLGATSLSLGITQGWGVFGAKGAGDGDVSRQEGEDVFTKLTGGISRLQAIPRSDISLFGNIKGQWANDPLLASEEYDVGGLQIGRGYDNSEITGDHGISGSVELRYNGIPSYEGLQPEWFCFYDAGKVWNIDDSALDAASFLSSAGTGIRFNYKEGVSGQVILGVPLTLESDTPLYGNGKSPRVLFTLYKRF